METIRAHAQAIVDLVADLDAEAPTEASLPASQLDAILLVVGRHPERFIYPRDVRPDLAAFGIRPEYDPSTDMWQMAQPGDGRLRRLGRGRYQITAKGLTYLTSHGLGQPINPAP